MPGIMFVIPEQNLQITGNFLGLSVGKKTELAIEMNIYERTKIEKVSKLILMAGRKNILQAI